MSASGSPYEIAANPTGIASGYSAYGSGPDAQGRQQRMDASGRGYWYQPGQSGAAGTLTDLSKPMTVAESAGKGLTGLVGTIDSPAPIAQQSQIGQVPGTTQPIDTIAQGVTPPPASAPGIGSQAPNTQGGTGSETPGQSGQPGQTTAGGSAGAAATPSAQPITSVGQLWPAGVEGQQQIGGVYQSPPGWNQVAAGGGTFLVGPDNVTTYSFNPQTGYITPFNGYVNGKMVRDYITQPSSTPAQTAPTAPAPGTAATAPPATPPPTSPAVATAPTLAPVTTPVPIPTAPAAAPTAPAPALMPDWSHINYSAGPSGGPGGGPGDGGGGGGDGGGGGGDGGGGDGGAY